MNLNFEHFYIVALVLLRKGDISCSFSASYFYFGFLLEHVYMLYCSKNNCLFV